METLEKAYVEVTCRYKTDGEIIPISILWEDGTVYPIDKVITVIPACSLKVGGTGIRYTVQIAGQTTYLFLEITGKWFVEKRVIN